jgi:3-hydroxy-3-methylglutaryl CoA synthase
MCAAAAAAYPVLVVEAVCVIADLARVVAAQLAVLEAAANEPAAAAAAAAIVVTVQQNEELVGCLQDTTRQSMNASDTCMSLQHA